MLAKERYAKLRITFFAVYNNSTRTFALTHFDNDVINEFFNTALQYKISEVCRSSINKIPRFLSSRNVLEEEREGFYYSFTKGNADFVGDDRWLFSFKSCFRASGDTPYARSEYPLDFCYGADTDMKTGYAICLPQPCEDDATQLLQLWTDLNVKNGSHKPLSEVECLESRKKTQWNALSSTLVDICINQTYIALIAFITVFDCVRRPKTKSIVMRALMAFSGRRTVKRLYKVPSKSKITIRCLMGLRVISMIWVFTGHAFAWVQGYIKNINEYREDISSNFFAQFISNFTLSVNTFFLLSAALTSYSWFSAAKKLEGVSWRSYGYWLRFYRHRLVRLWPAYIYIIIFATFRSSVHSTSSVWPDTDPHIQCPKHWLENIFFINCFTHTPCLGWTWLPTNKCKYILEKRTRKITAPGRRIG
ncbi:unnamed protein product [Enterobius vermicularis]|uniref:Acyl_transf_3 domain-containing protein n=1 Tax=Enterobius vermicularis TaxID=51028 RepID=A0A0N4V9V4_ENTVE|nr:unnamed protein product [Enterobius vermicularis]